MPPDPQMRWLRLWTDILEDPKLLLLAAEDRWYYIALLACKRSGLMDEGDPPELRDRKVSLRLRIDHRERDELKRRLQEVRLIDENWQPLGWEKRQFASDTDRTAAERQRRHRETLRHGDVTRDKRVSNDPVTDESRASHGHVTTPEQSRVRAEQSKSARKRASSVSTEFPLDFALDEALRAQALKLASDCDVEAAFEQFRAHHQANGSTFKSWPAAWRTWIGNFDRFGYPKRKSVARDIGELIKERTGWR